MKDAHSIISHQPALFHPAKHSSKYTRAFRIALDGIADSKKWPLYEFRLSKAGIERIRLDFVPVDLGPGGLIELHAVLITLMDGGFEFVRKFGSISRLDVAVDFPDLEMNDLFILPKQGVSNQQWSSNGSLQTIQLGKAKTSHTCVYDRRAKRAAQGQQTQVTGIRLERRIKYQHLSFGDLSELPCPFGGLLAVSRIIPPPPGEKKVYIWNFFLSHAEFNGLPTALAELPTEKRTLYRKHFKLYPLENWNLDEIWKKWPAMLDEMGILTLAP